VVNGNLTTNARCLRTRNSRCEDQRASEGFMITRNVTGDSCRPEGQMEEHDTINIVPESELFKDSSTGYIHFRCPSCKAHLAVDPLKVIGAIQMIDYTKRNMTYPVIFVAIGIVLALVGLYFQW
jgi:hypothetical protein